MDSLNQIIADSEQIHDDVQTLVRDLRKTLEEYEEAIANVR